MVDCDLCPTSCHHYRQKHTQGGSSLPSSSTNWHMNRCRDFWKDKMSQRESCGFALSFKACTGETFARPWGPVSSDLTWKLFTPCTDQYFLTFKTDRCGCTVSNRWSQDKMPFSTSFFDFENVHSLSFLILKGSFEQSGKLQIGNRAGRSWPTERSDRNTSIDAFWNECVWKEQETPRCEVSPNMTDRIWP